MKKGIKKVPMELDLTKPKFILSDKLKPTKDDLIVSLDYGMFSTEGSAESCVKEFSSEREIYIFQVDMKPITKMVVERERKKVILK